MNIQVRKAQSEDAPALAALLRSIAAYQLSVQGVVSAEFLQQGRLARAAGWRQLCLLPGVDSDEDHE